MQGIARKHVLKKKKKKENMFCCCMFSSFLSSLHLIDSNLFSDCKKLQAWAFVSRGILDYRD